MENCAGQIQKTLSDLCMLFWLCQNKIQSKNIYEFSSPQTKLKSINSDLTKLY